MGTLVERTPDGAIDGVYSPDDGGWYAQEYKFSEKKARVSLKIYPSLEDLRRALGAGKHKWEKWS